MEQIVGKIIVIFQMIEEVASHAEEEKNNCLLDKELHYRRLLFILNILEYNNYRVVFPVRDELSWEEQLLEV